MPKAIRVIRYINWIQENSLLNAIVIEYHVIFTDIITCEFAPGTEGALLKKYKVEL